MTTGTNYVATDWGGGGTLGGPGDVGTEVPTKVKGHGKMSRMGPEQGTEGVPRGMSCTGPTKTLVTVGTRDHGDPL